MTATTPDSSNIPSTPAPVMPCWRRISIENIPTVRSGVRLLFGMHDIDSGQFKWWTGEYMGSAHWTLTMAPITKVQPIWWSYVPDWIRKGEGAI